MKKLDCFLNAHGSYTSKLVSLKMKKESAFSEFRKDLYISIGSANDIVNTPIKNPIPIKKHRNDSSNCETNTYHTLKIKDFIAKLLSFSNQLFFDVGNTLLKSSKSLKIQFTNQILKQLFYNLSDSFLKTLQ